MKRSDYLALAQTGLRMPIGADLVLREHPDAEAILVDGQRLGEVIAETAHRHRTPLAIPLMDLTLEKAALLDMLDVPTDQAPTYHFREWSSDAPFDQLARRMPAYANPRLTATREAIRYIATQTELEPIGMVIGPLSLMTKLLADPITPLFQAGRGRAAAENPAVLLAEKLSELATRVVLWSVERQLTAGARAVIVCEPAAGTAYISPRQRAARTTGPDLLEKFVLAPNQRVKALLAGHDAELIFHCCAELTPDFVRTFVQLDPVLLSLGSSRKLWEDAALVPKTIVLYGNLPTKSFYSDETCPVTLVVEKTRELLARMRATGHPFILGSECDVLSVPGAEETIRRKVEAFMQVEV